VFDLAQEKEELRTRYGRNTFGQSCLVARRLVERGVPFVTINYKGWDTHKENFAVLRRQLPKMRAPSVAARNAASRPRQKEATTRGIG
jgi:hypothetical protein